MSRLLKEVRENRGWAYSIGSGIDEYADVGDLIIGAGLPKNKLNEAIELITEISLGLGGNSKWEITQKELDIAKETYKGRLALAFDKPETVLGVALEDLMFEGDIKTPDYVIDKINKVTMKDIKEVCNLVFKPSNLSIAVVGNYKNLDFKI
jgi:predicted Zn-dependent peptidase